MDSSPLPTVQRAIVQGPDGYPLIISPRHPIPPLRRGQVLVRVHAVALNPTDYKMPSNFASPGAVCGCDFSGEVVATDLSSSTESNGAQVVLAPGDAVFGCVHGSNPIDKDRGAFAEYVIAEADLICKAPREMGWLQAGAWGGIGWSTLGIALWESDRGLGLRWPWGQYNKNKERAVLNEGDPVDRPGAYVLVNGGATATGTLAIQLLKLPSCWHPKHDWKILGVSWLTHGIYSAGYTPIATCSSDNAAFVRSFGAAQTFDYNSPSCGHSIRAQTKNLLKYVLDCIADTASTQLCYAAMARAGGRYVCLELPATSVLEARKAVQWRFVMGYEIFGREIALSNGYERDGSMGADHKKRAVRWAQEVQRLIDGGWLKGHRLEQLEGRWEDSVLKGLERLRTGGVRGSKLVVEVHKGMALNAR